MKGILAKASEIVVPSSEEQEKVNGLVEGIIAKVAKAAKTKRVYAELMVGGSIGKDSWLPGNYDLDFFFRFDPSKYAARISELSDLTEKVLTHAFPKVERVHGSRDYFQINLDGVIAEIIPVLKIDKVGDAKNITDASPLHVGWVKKKISKNKSLSRDIRLSKMFFKAQRCYGAESFISGFSGHVIEILTCKYGSFEKLVKAVKTWEVGQIIDVEKHYKKSDDVLSMLNEEKTHSSIIVIDPIEASRNAAASLREEVFQRLKNSCSAYTTKPSASYFEIKKVTLEDMKKLERKTKKLVAFEASPLEGKKDVIGSKFLKQYKHIIALFEDNDFAVIDSDWFWDYEGPALFFFFVDPKELSKTKILKGPQTYGMQEHIMAFKKKYQRKRLWREGYHYYAEIPREFRKIADILKAVKKDEEFTNLKLSK